MQAEVTAALRAVSSSVDLIKKINDLAAKTKNSELINEIANLNLEMASAKLALANAIAESIEREKEILDLKTKLNAIGSLTFRNGVYYKEGEDSPYCPGCFDGQKKMIHLALLPCDFTDFGKYRCPRCGTTFQ